MPQNRQSADGVSEVGFGDPLAPFTRLKAVAGAAGHTRVLAAVQAVAVSATQAVRTIGVRLHVASIGLVVDPYGGGGWGQRHGLLHEARETDGAERLEHTADLCGRARQVAACTGRQRVVRFRDIRVEVQQGMLEPRRVAGELGQHLL